MILSNSTYTFPVHLRLVSFKLFGKFVVLMIPRRKSLTIKPFLMLIP